MATNDFIQITRSSTNQSQNLGNARDALRQSASQVLEVYGNMQHLTMNATTAGRRKPATQETSKGHIFSNIPNIPINTRYEPFGMLPSTTSCVDGEMRV